MLQFPQPPCLPSHSKPKSTSLSHRRLTHPGVPLPSMRLSRKTTRKRRWQAGTGTCPHQFRLVGPCHLFPRPLERPPERLRLLAATMSISCSDHADDARTLRGWPTQHGNPQHPQGVGRRGHECNRPFSPLAGGVLYPPARPHSRCRAHLAAWEGLTHPA